MSNIFYNKFKRLVDALEYEDDLTKNRTTKRTTDTRNK